MSVKFLKISSSEIDRFGLIRREEGGGFGDGRPKTESPRVWATVIFSAYILIWRKAKELGERECGV